MPLHPNPLYLGYYNLPHSNLLAKVRVCMCYILSIEQQVLRPSFPFDRSSKKKKKSSAREIPMEREKVAEVFLDFLFKGPGQITLLG